MINFFQEEKSCRDKERQEKDKRKLRSTSPKLRSSHSEKYRKTKDQKYGKENHKLPLKSSLRRDKRSHEENGRDSKHSNIKKYSNNSSSSDTKVDSIRCIEGQKKKIKTTLDNLFGEQQDMKKGVLQTTDDLEDGEISEEEIVK